MSPERNPWMAAEGFSDKPYEWRYGSYQTPSGKWRNPETGDAIPSARSLAGNGIFRFAIRDSETGATFYRSVRGPFDIESIGAVVSGLLFASP